MAYQIAILSLLLLIGSAFLWLVNLGRLGERDRKRNKLKRRMLTVVSCNERNRETDDLPSSVFAINRTKKTLINDRKMISQNTKETVVNFLKRAKEYMLTTLTKFKAKVLSHVVVSRVKMLIRTTYDMRGDSEDHDRTNKSN